MTMQEIKNRAEDLREIMDLLNSDKIEEQRFGRKMLRLQSQLRLKKKKQFNF